LSKKLLVFIVSTSVYNSIHELDTQKNMFDLFCDFRIRKYFLLLQITND